MIIGGYDLHVYCDFHDDSYDHRGGGDYPGPGFIQSCEPKMWQSFKVIKDAGWTITRDKRALCPYCKEKGRKLPRHNQHTTKETNGQDS